MKTPILTKIAALFVTVVMTTLSCNALAEDAKSPIAVLMPSDPQSEYAGGFSQHGKVTGFSSGENEPVRLTTGYLGGVVRWFCDHLWVPKAKIDSWGRYGIRVELRSPKADANVEGNAVWLGVAEPPEYSPSAKGNVQLKAGQWGEILFPAPYIAGMKAEKIRGLLLQLSEGEYEIRRIEIVPLP